MNPHKHAQMIGGFEKFTDRIYIRYHQVRDCLKANRYEEAQLLLDELTVSHARTALSLKSMLIKNGALPPEE